MYTTNITYSDITTHTHARARFHYF